MRTSKFQSGDKVTVIPMDCLYGGCTGTVDAEVKRGHYRVRFVGHNNPTQIIEGRFLEAATLTPVIAQQMVASARRCLLDMRDNATVQSCHYMNLQPAWNEAWQILFAAENLISDPNNPHYQRIVREVAA